LSMSFGVCGVCGGLGGLGGVLRRRWGVGLTFIWAHLPLLLGFPFSVSPLHLSSLLSHLYYLPIWCLHVRRGAAGASPIIVAVLCGGSGGRRAQRTVTRRHSHSICCWSQT